MNLRDLSCFFEYPVAVPDHKIAYWPVPKNACTSLKYAFYRLKTGHDFKPLTFQGKYLYHIHRIFPPRLFQEKKRYQDWIRLAIVRNPLERIVSAYCNRILYHNDLSRHKLQLTQKGLNCQPGFTEFIQNLADYRTISKSIKYHTDPQVLFLGENPSYYTDLVNVKDLKQLPDLLGIQSLDLPMKQDGGGEYKKEVLSQIKPEMEQRISDFYQKDYQFLSKLNDPRLLGIKVKS